MRTRLASRSTFWVKVLRAPADNALRVSLWCTSRGSTWATLTGREQAVRRVSASVASANASALARTIVRGARLTARLCPEDPAGHEYLDLTDSGGLAL